MTLATMLSATMPAVLYPTWITRAELVKRHSFVQTFIYVLNAKQALLFPYCRFKLIGFYALAFFTLSKNGVRVRECMLNRWFGPFFAISIIVTRGLSVPASSPVKMT